MTYGFCEHTVRAVLSALSLREMYASLLLSSMKKNGTDLPEGDGFLIPLLLLLEREELICSRLAAADGGEVRRFYSITPWGLLLLKKDIGLAEKAPDKEQKKASALKYDGDLEGLLAPVRGRRAKKRLLRDCSEYMADVGREHFGDAEALRARIADIANEKRSRLSAKAVLMTVGLSLLTAGILILLWVAWGVFVPQCVAIVVGVYLLFRLFKACRIFSKRRRAIRKLTKIARAAGYSVEQRESALGSLLKKRPYPTLLLQKGKALLKIRFAAATARAQLIRFSSPYIYRTLNLRGLAMGVTHPLFRRGAFFKPKEMDTSLFRFTHTDLVEFEKGIELLPIPDKRFDGDLSVREVVLLNPPPMKALYLEGGSQTELVGGEIKEGVEINDVFGFCRSLKKENE